MRIMVNKKTGQEVKVVEHIIIQNFWEYYVIEDERNTDEVKLCFVMGFENEMGDVYIPEIKPFIKTRTKNLHEVMPASGFTWKET